MCVCVCVVLSMCVYCFISKTEMHEKKWCLFSSSGIIAKNVVFGTATAKRKTEGIAEKLSWYFIIGLMSLSALELFCLLII